MVKATAGMALVHRAKEAARLTIGSVSCFLLLALLPHWDLLGAAVRASSDLPSDVSTLSRVSVRNRRTLNLQQK